MNTPSLVVLQMGSYSKKRVRRLKKGRLPGKIAARIEPYLAETTGRKVIPVILLYRKKRTGGGRARFPSRLF